MTKRARLLLADTTAGTFSRAIGAATAGEPDNMTTEITNAVVIPLLMFAPFLLVPE
jgi:hypothetical protein